MEEPISVICPSCSWKWKTRGRRVRIMCPNCKKDQKRELLLSATEKETPKPIPKVDKAIKPEWSD